jgi:hypothetical protein
MRGLWPMYDGKTWPPIFLWLHPENTLVRWGMDETSFWNERPAHCLAEDLLPKIGSSDGATNLDGVSGACQRTVSYRRHLSYQHGFRSCQKNGSSTI